ncbi:hypothetical protein GWI33_018062 [Rhynchophorus ferrugineus]|uniref:Uncharacterized protein n=1 Tax=Rhynchophorus ferrugineus TaxID=354439 RepID=A0A834HYK3_RHYFE|nr:hypothetical protein GWI33_018062 [Rhynchophorus ferrugineus]
MLLHVDGPLSVHQTARRPGTELSDPQQTRSVTFSDGRASGTAETAETEALLTPSGRLALSTLGHRHGHGVSRRPPSLFSRRQKYGSILGTHSAIFLVWIQ